MSDVAENAGNILAGIEGVKKGLAELRRKIGDSENRSATERAAYAEAYRGAVREALDYVEILGLPDLGRESRESRLSVAYLSLTTNTAGIGRLEYEELLDLLPYLGGRLLIEGVAGSGKSTLLRWTAVQAAQEMSTSDRLTRAPLHALSR
jgi:ABC-type uncharacterized transport system fused permease/ATPase subunit